MDAAARRARTRRQVQGLGVFTLIVVVLAVPTLVWRLVSDRLQTYVSNAHVTASQKAEIAAYYVAHDPFGDGHTHAGCPVDVLGAHRAGLMTTAYTVVHCWTGDAHCGLLSDGTTGVVARLVDGRVRSEVYDDAVDYGGARSEASIYPNALRRDAFNLMDSDGPRGYDKTAMVMSGCPPD
jgi:hypothetical protein